VNWDTICSALKDGGLKIINLHHENNAYLLKLAWNFAYSNKPWSFLLKARVLNVEPSGVQCFEESKIL